MHQNKTIIELFTKLIKQTEEECFQLKELGLKKDSNTCQFKIKNYKKGLDIIKDHSTKIETAKDLDGISGIGKGIMARIEEILSTGTLSELKTNSQTNITPKLAAIEELLLITGIGPKSAHKLYDEGITLELLLNELNQLSDGLNPQTMTVEDIIYRSIHKKLNLHNLTHHQIVGLKYFHDINERIPRAELTKIETKLIKQIHQIDPKLVVTICGSYRRELPTSGDIDVLITHPDMNTEEDIMDDGKHYLINIVQKLTKTHLIIDDLTKLGTTKYMGICQLTPKSKARRIDIRFVARDNYAPALLYFTGSKNFNQQMRGEALQLGYTINEYGIYKLKTQNGKYIHKKGAKILVNTEKDIFDLVNMDYVEPKDRL